MESLHASEIFSALGHESRLAIFRLLVEAGPGGLSAGVIGEAFGMPPATASFHLAHLARVGLIQSTRESRFVYYSAHYATMDDLIAFLTDNCCQGGPCLPKAEAVRTTELRRRLVAAEALPEEME